MAWLALAFLAPIRGTSQPEADNTPPPTVFRALAVGNTASGLLYDIAPRKPFTVEAGGMYLSRDYPTPVGGRVSFYRLLPPVPPDTTPRRSPVAELTLSPGGPYLLVLASTPDPVAPGMFQTQVFSYDDSWKEHPLQTTRMLNFSRRLIAAQFAGEVVELKPGESHIFPADISARAVPLKVARWEENRWVLKLRRLQGGVPNTRATLLISDVPPTPENPDPAEINLTHIFDTSRPPES